MCSGTPGKLRKPALVIFFLTSSYMYNKYKDLSMEPCFLEWPVQPVCRPTVNKKAQKEFLASPIHSKIW